MVHGHFFPAVAPMTRNEQSGILRQTKTLAKVNKAKVNEK
jgi:hypothetical protein